MAGLGHETAAGGDRGRLRASHADREHVIDTLKAAYVDGLVTKDEFDARVSQTLASRTYAELAVVTADIPAGLPAAPPPLTPAAAQAGPPAHARLEPGERAVVATAVLAGALFVAAFFAGNANAIGGLVALGALGSALVCLFLAAQMISARRGRRSGATRRRQKSPGGGCGRWRSGGYSPDTAELGAFVHVDDVAAATLLALSADLHGHHRLTLCGPGSFDTSRARTILGWTADRTW